MVGRLFFDVLLCAGSIGDFLFRKGRIFLYFVEVVIENEVENEA